MSDPKEPTDEELSDAVLMDPSLCPLCKLPEVKLDKCPERGDVVTDEAHFEYSCNSCAATWCNVFKLNSATDFKH